MENYFYRKLVFAKSKSSGTSNYADIDNLTITENKNGEIQAVGVLNDKDKETLVKLWTGTKAEYDAIEEKDDATLYNITDDYEEPEIVANKTTIIDANSTDTQYPSAKAVYDIVQNGPGAALDDVVPKQTATDSIINVNDALKYKTFNFKVDGAYEQNGEPTPETPVPITTLNFNEIMNCSQNLFDLDDVKQVDNNEKITTNVDDDGFIHVDIDNTDYSSETFANYWTNISKNLITNHDYLGIIEVKEYSGSGYNCFVGTEIVSQFKTGITYWSQETGIFIKKITTKDSFTDTDTMLRSFIQCPANSKVSITYRISIIADLTVTPDTFTYQPYKETNYQIDLQGNEMVALPKRIKDELVIDKNGNVSLIKNVGKKIFNGTEDGWWLHESNQFRIQLPGVSSWGELLSNRFIEGANYEPGEMLAYIDNYIFFISDKLNVEDWKTWLQSNNVVVYYELKEPQTINLGKLENLISTDEGANTFVINGNIDTQISITYALDIKKYIDNKISTVSQAVLEQE